MDPVISDLLDRYEGGRLSRRDLVTGLSALAATAAAAPALAQSAPPALTPTGVDHVSILVADLKSDISDTSVKQERSLIG